ncbi:MAG: nucleotidyltransferase family protein [Candidatus Micrarchaeota archaeon]|nr:nucleotidyltransferase family protein [Candidatus Micrarchaeota archaeon]
MKERLTITLDENMLSLIDEGVDGVNIRNRSHAIERYLGIALGYNAPRKVLIFAGGNPISLNGKAVVSPMVMVSGKPILWYIINELKRNRITEILLAIGRESNSIVEHFGDGGAFGVKIRYIMEDAQKGTEGALLLVKGFVGNSPFFALNGDHIFRMDMNEMYNQHTSTKAIATIAITPASAKSHFGVTRLEGNRITSFIEKGESDREAHLVNAGIYVFGTSVFDYIRQSQGRQMLEHSLFPKLVSQGRLYGYVFSSPWYSIDNITDRNRSIRELEAVAKRVQGMAQGQRTA